MLAYWIIWVVIVGMELYFRTIWAVLIFGIFFVVVLSVESVRMDSYCTKHFPDIYNKLGYGRGKMGISLLKYRPDVPDARIERIQKELRKFVVSEIIWFISQIPIGLLMGVLNG